VKGNRNADRLALALIVAMYALAAWTWPSAPAQIPIHWNFAGQIDRYGSKVNGLLFLPTIALAAYAVIGLTAVLRPEKFDGPALGALSWSKLASVLVVAGVFGVTVADARGANINMNYVMLPLLAVFVTVNANLLLRLNRIKMSKAAPPGGGILI
jgi:immunity protein, SdpI family